MAALKNLSHSISTILKSSNNNKVYIYGCGASGRLAKQIESETWRQYSFDQEKISNKVIGELTGGDRALVSALEGFEDLAVIGELQLKVNQISKGDVVIVITEGGLTTSAIGTIKSARGLYEDAEEASKYLYYCFNNPLELLLPFDRIKPVANDTGITKIPLWTGSMALGGSTRMQASTIQQYVISILLEDAVLTDSNSLEDRLLSFVDIQN